jgi:hypothetical protein
MATRIWTNIASRIAICTTMATVATTMNAASQPDIPTPSKKAYDAFVSRL